MATLSRKGMREMRPKNHDDLRVVKIFLFILIATPASALGAVHAESLGVYFSLAALFCGYLFAYRRVNMPPVDLPSIVLIGLIAFTWFQLVPLPSEAVSLLAPSVYEIRKTALSPLHQDAPAWMPLTLDAGLTVMEVGKLAFYLLIYWGARRLTRQIGSDFIFRVVTAAGVIGASVLICHRIVMPEKIYGFYSPEFAFVSHGRISAPLINENHLAAFLGLCAAVAVGRAAEAASHSAKIIAASIAALLGGAVMLTLSRGGIAAFIVGQCLFVGMRIWAKKDVGSSRVGWILAVSAASLGLGLFVAQDALVSEFADGSIKKLDLLREELPLIARFPITGAGRGSFVAAFGLVSRTSAAFVVTHAENAVIQLLTDFGLIVGGFALAAFVFIVGRFLLRPPSSVSCAAALAALTAFGIHNLMDFNLEILGVAVIPAALIGVLYARASARASVNPSSHPKRIPRPLVAAVGATALAAALFAFLFVRPFGLDTEEKRLREQIRDAKSTLFSPASLREALLRHPSDAYIPLYMGIRLYHFQTENPLPWLARAITLKPFMPEAHFYIGAVLLRAGILDQAMLEFRIAFRTKPSLARPAARLLVAKVPAFERLSKTAVTTEDRMMFFPAVAEALAAAKFPREADKADLAVLKILPNNPESATRHARRLMEQGALDEAESLAKRMMSNRDSYVVAVLLMSAIFDKRDAPEKSAALLEDAQKKVGRNPDLMRSLATAKLHMGDFDGAVRAAEGLKVTSFDNRERARAILFEADIYAAFHRIQGALALLREAQALVPSDVGILEKRIALAEAARDDKQVLEALWELATLRPDDPAVQSRLKARLNDIDAAFVPPAENPP